MTYRLYILISERPYRPCGGRAMFGHYKRAATGLFRRVRDAVRTFGPDGIANTAKGNILGRM